MLGTVLDMQPVIPCQFNVCKVVVTTHKKHAGMSFSCMYVCTNANMLYPTTAVSSSLLGCESVVGTKEVIDPFVKIFASSGGIVQASLVNKTVCHITTDIMPKSPQISISLLTSRITLFTLPVRLVCCFCYISVEIKGVYLKMCTQIHAFTLCRCQHFLLHVSVKKNLILYSILVGQVISTFSQHSHAFLFQHSEKTIYRCPSLPFVFLSSSCCSSILLTPTILIPIILPFHCPILSIFLSSYFLFHSSLLPPLILSSPSFRYIILSFHPPATLFYSSLLPILRSIL